MKYSSLKEPSHLGGSSSSGAEVPWMGIVTVENPHVQRNISAHISASFIAGFCKFSVCLANKLGRDSTRVWFMQQHLP